VLIGSAELLGESFDLLFELVDCFVSGIIVDGRLIGDVGGFGGIGEGRDVLVEEHVVRADTGYHQAVTVASDGLLQN
jgi:hypothetical protein